MHLNIGTRGSPLALAQTNIFIKKLSEIANFTFEIVIIKTTGDKILDKPLYDIGGKALFIKELEEALLSKKIDIAVHSLKDVPGVIDQRFILGCYLKRDFPHDCLVSYKAKNLLELPLNAKIGSSSPRRAIYLKKLRPDLEVIALRGNINSRLEKLKNQEFDAIILAEAGMRRLNIFDENICTPISIEQMIPAVGQGVITVQLLSENKNLTNLLEQVNDIPTSKQIMIEREFLAELNASCRTPVAGFVEKVDGRYKGHFMVANDDLTKIKTFESFIEENTNAKMIANNMLENFHF